MLWRGSLFRKYAFFFVLLVSVALVASGAEELYFSYQESKEALVALQREKALGAGCDDFDTKPVDFARLVEKIEALLGRAGGT